MQSSRRLVIYAALAGNLLIALTKFVAASITGSSAMVAEGIHSLVDTGNQVLLLHGLRRARKPADERFPFGHGKEIYFWSFIVAIMVFAVGAGVSIYEGVYRLLHPASIENFIVNYVILALAILFEGVSWFIAFREFGRSRGGLGWLEAVQRAKDPTVLVVLFEDTAALSGLIVALAAIALTDITGYYAFDAGASIVIGLILAGTAAWIAYETKGLLIGERAAAHVVDGIREMLAQWPGVEHVNEVLTMHMGPDYILVNVSVDFADALGSADVEGLVAGMDAAIKARFPDVKRVFMEAEARRHLPE